MLVSVCLFPLRVIFIRELTLRPLVTSDGGAGRLRLWEGIRRLIRVLTKERAKDHGAFTRLRPTTSRPRVFNLGLRMSKDGKNVFCPRITYRQINGGRCYRYHVNGGLQYLLLTVKRFLRFVLLIRRCRLPYVTTFQHKYRRNYFRRDSSLFLYRFFFYGLPRTTTYFCRFARAFRGSFVYWCTGIRVSALAVVSTGVQSCFLGLRTVPLGLAACCHKDGIPSLPNAGAFRSARLFQVCRTAPKCAPVLVITSRSSGPITGLLTTVHGDIHVFPPNVVGEYRICNAKRCFGGRTSGRVVFDSVLRELAGRTLHSSFLVRFHGLRGTVFKCGSFQSGRCVTVG